MNWQQYGRTLREHAAHCRHRYLVTVSGERSWAINTAEQLLESTQALWVSDRLTAVTNVVKNQDADQLLGQEFRSVVYDGHCGINPNALGVVSGTIAAGGLLILLNPESEMEYASGDHSDDHPDTHIPQQFSPGFNPYYLKRCIRLLEKPGLAVQLRQGQQPKSIRALDLPTQPPPKEDLKDNYPGATQDQADAIAAILKVVSGQRKRPAVLVSDRGRGKSAALGIAARILHSGGLNNIIVTGRNRKSAQSVFHHAETNTANSSAQLTWRNIEDLITYQPSCDLLLIDEAASIPIGMLEQLLIAYPRIAMATTVHGYEGTGRGFMLRFTRILDQLTRGWKKLQLVKPIRWSDHDPLEYATNRILMLDAELPAVQQPNPPKLGFDLTQCRIEWIDQKTLSINEGLLREIFSLLVLAHYKTRPGDLKQLLDNPNIRIYRMFKENQGVNATVAVAVVVREGRLTDNVGRDIFQGNCRPVGHVLPEILASQFGLSSSVRLTMGRIMRIVVHPEVQGVGVGSALLTYIRHQRQMSFDLIGANFAVSKELVNFWQRNSFSLVRIGLTQTPQSGANSVVYLYPCTEQGRLVCQQATVSFARNFPLQLKSVLSGLDTDIVAAMVADNAGLKSDTNLNLLAEAASFCCGCRPGESIPVALTSLAIQALIDQNLQDANLVIEHVLQGKPWAECESLTGDQGRVEGINRIRKSFSSVLEHYHQDFVLQYKQRMLV